MMIPAFCLNIKKYNCTTGNDSTKNTEIWVPLKYLNNFWTTLGMPLVNCEINLILTWPENCALMSRGIDNHVPTFATTDTKFYVPVVTLSNPKT